MFSIIPNWHPIFVHFTVALFSTAVGFYVLAYLTAYLKGSTNSFAIQFENTARWCLWIVAIITIATVLAGFYAYNTVQHDAVSHHAMTIHRNWAVPTAIAILLIAGWSYWRYHKQKKLALTFVFILLIAQGLLLSTAWRGAELVFRYGLGVMSLPQSEGMSHHHHHADENPTMSPTSATSASPSSSTEAHHHEHTADDQD